jgi:hypothetical protein
MQDMAAPGSLVKFRARSWITVLAATLVAGVGVPGCAEKLTPSRAVVRAATPGQPAGVCSPDPDDPNGGDCVDAGADAGVDTRAPVSVSGPSGTPCNDSGQCATGFCADGICCDEACTGACTSCNQPGAVGTCQPVGAGNPDPHHLCRTDSPQTCGQNGICTGEGACAQHPPNTVCAPSSCNAAGQYVPTGLCDGLGTCVPGLAISCDPSICDAQAGACVLVCKTRDQCVPGKDCVDGSCGKLGAGQTCAKNDDCGSGFCVDGVCCDSACAGACQTCASPAARGQCVPVNQGAVDPHHVCVVSAPSTCGTDGKCAAGGACAIYSNSTVCRPAKCDAAANTASAAVKCQAGKCPAASAKSCAPFDGCKGTTCLGTCSRDDQCTGGNVCNEGTCGRDTGGGPGRGGNGGPGRGGGGPGRGGNGNGGRGPGGR